MANLWPYPRRWALILGHGGRWTEADYFALGETADRIELVDGSLLVDPVQDLLHQAVSSALVAALRPPARAVGLSAHRAVNLRLCAGRIVIPDLVVSDADRLGLVMDAAGWHWSARWSRPVMPRWSGC
jgi:hypothetical protein